MMQSLVLRAFRVVNSTLKSLKVDSPSPRDINHAISALSSPKISNFELSELILYLEKHINNTSHYPTLISTLSQLSTQREFLSDSSLASLLWFLKRKNLTDDGLYLEIFKKLEGRMTNLTNKSLSQLIDSISAHPHLATPTIIERLQKSIIENQGSFSAIDLYYISRGYKALYKPEIDEPKVFKVIESELLRLLPLLNLDTISTTLACISRGILRNPSDVPSAIESHICELLNSASPTKLCRVLSIYSSLPLFNHYYNIYSTCEKRILADPSAYFSSPDDLFVTVLHTYSKTFGYQTISDLFPIHLPSLPPSLIKSSSSLGVFFYSALRKIISNSYDEFIIDEVYRLKDRIRPLYKKKIIVTMALRNQPDHIFWRNVSELGIKFDKNEFMAQRYKDLLESHGFVLS